MRRPILVVGVAAEGPSGLADAVREQVDRADILCGGVRLLEFWADHPAEKIAVGADIPALVERLKNRGDALAVVLGSGDPGFYGIAGTLLRHFPPGELEIVPGVNSLQLAFARARIPWSDAVFTSAHSRPIGEVVGWARRAPKLGILTDSVNTPQAIARALLRAGVPDCRAVVAENLGLPEERIFDTRLSALVDSGVEFAPLNVLVLAHDEEWQPVPTFAPRPDDAYEHRCGLITKADVRALSIARLALRETDTVWDVGAGSGAMSVEMAELAWRGRVFAVEHDAENVGYVRQNAERFGVPNVNVVEGHAPTALEGLPAPSAVFVGGTGGEMEGILRHVAAAALPGCRLVINLATLENLHEATQLMRSLGLSPELAQVNVLHGGEIAGLTRLSPLNPVFILSTTVESEKEE